MNSNLTIWNQIKRYFSKTIISENIKEEIEIKQQAKIEKLFTPQSTNITDECIY